MDHTDQPFNPEDRDSAFAHLLAFAQSDPRIVAGALLGSLSHGPGDRFSDLDLSFAVADAGAVTAVLDSIATELKDQFGALRLFDIAAGGFSYRVFMTPSCLQIDVSLAPAELFGALGPNFRLLFGKSVTRSTSPAVPAEQMFGQAVHHALRARVSIERGRFWQAEYWLSQTRQLVLYLLCLDHSLPPSLGRGIDDLPADVRARFLATLVGDLRPDTLESALREVVRELLKGPGGTQDMAAQVRPGLVCMARRQSLWTHEPPQTR